MVANSAAWWAECWAARMAGCSDNWTAAPKAKKRAAKKAVRWADQMASTWDASWAEALAASKVASLAALKAEKSAFWSVVTMAPTRAVLMVEYLADKMAP